VLSIGKGADSRIFKTTNAGESWTTQFTNANADAFFDAMAFWDANNGIAVSDSVNGAFVIITTRDGGRSWAPVGAGRLRRRCRMRAPSPPAAPTSRTYGSDRVWFGTGAGPRARVLRSSDRGASWQIADTPLRAGPSAGIYSIAFRDCPARRHRRRRLHQDRGSHRQRRLHQRWRKDSGPVKDHGLGGFRSVVAYVPGSRASFVAVGPSGSDMSTDDGRTWAPIEGPGFDTFSFCARTDDRMGFGRARRDWAAGSEREVAGLES
jgi:hypothetical protein